SRDDSSPRIQGSRPTPASSWLRSCSTSRPRSSSPSGFKSRSRQLRSRPHTAHRNLEPKRRPHVGLGSHADPPTVLLDDGLRDREPKPGPAPTPVIATVELLKAGE